MITRDLECPNEKVKPTGSVLLQTCIRGIGLITSLLVLVCIVDLIFAYSKEAQLTPYAIKAEASGPDVKISLTVGASATLIQPAQVIRAPPTTLSQINNAFIKYR